MTSSAVQPSPQAAVTAHLVTALKRLDAILSTALQAMEAQLGTAVSRVGTAHYLGNCYSEVA